MLKLKAIAKLKQLIENDYGITGLSENKIEEIGINLLALFETLIIDDHSNSKFIEDKGNDKKQSSY